MTTTTVSQLSPGQAFRVDLGPAGHLDYVLMYSNNCRARVKSMARTKRTITRRDDLSDLTGEAPAVVAQFDAPGAETDISPGTECAPLEVAERSDDIDDLLGTAPAPRAARKAATPGATRPLDPATKRGRVVGMLAAGKTFQQVCAELGINRGCALSHLSDARKFNGVQYAVDGDRAKVTA